MSEIVIVVASIVTAIATGVIAVYAWKSHKLADAMEKQNEEYQQETKDLYQAIVVATIISSASGGVPTFPIQTFKELYKGKTQIFE